jgi:hypothetical protein
MKKLLTTALLACLFLLLLEDPVYSRQSGPDGPPVAQALVREGDFAVDLVEALQMGAARDEAQAESTLAAIGIAPRNGWIADYPLTPDIIVEVENAVGKAASAGKLELSRSAAVQAVQTVSANLGFSVTAVAGDQTQNWSPLASSEYADPTVINNYYYDAGPPVITYYTPPWDYYYLYSWVPYPFWWSGWFFGGYFMLNDFDCVVRVPGRFYGHNFHGNRFMSKRVTNHMMDRNTGQFARINPVARGAGTAWKTAPPMAHSRSYNTSQAQQGAQAILRHSMGRMPSDGTRNPSMGRDSNLRSTALFNAAGGSAGQSGAGRNPAASNFAGRGYNLPRPSTPQHMSGTSGNEGLNPSGGRSMGSVNRSQGFENGGGINPSPSDQQKGNAPGSSRWGGGASVQGFQRGGGAAETFRGGGGSFSALNGGAGASGGLHSSGGGFSGGFPSTGGSFGGFHGGGFGHGGGGHGGR